MHFLGFLGSGVISVVPLFVLTFFVPIHPVLGTAAPPVARTRARAPAQGQDQAPILPPQLLIPSAPGNGAELEGEHEFALRQIFHHGSHLYPSLHRRLDISPDTLLYASSDDVELVKPVTFSARSNGIQIQRLVDRRPATINALLSTARAFGSPATLSASAWMMDDVSAPNISDKETVVNLARMAQDAYVPIPEEGDWLDIGQSFNRSAGFGWEGDGLRGYVFADKDNSTIIVSIKGTTTAVFDGSETTTNDKVNDNLFFSCCCGQGGQYLWRQVCDCQTSTYTCNSTCLVQALREENRYYAASRELYGNVTEIYPNSNIWLVGHSLGGAVSSLLGLTYGRPTVTYEAPAEALAAARLGLPAPPGSYSSAPQTRKFTGAYHFGNTADPIFMGSCNGAAATCTLAGYAMETQCHTGQTCVYDTVSDYGWRVGIGNHRIKVVIASVLEKYEDVPICQAQDECVDCFNWKFFESNSSDPITTSTSLISTTSSATPTRTTTCKTPGWWGCLDKTTTTSASQTWTTITTTTSTSTCKTPGWFGCKDPTTTAATATATAIVTTTAPTVPKTTCHTPGWFGCNDPTTTSSTVPITWTLPSTIQRSSQLPPTSPASSSTCKTPGWFWGCRDESTTAAASTTTSTNDATHVITPTPPGPTKTQGDDPSKHHKHKGKCKKRNWFGFCKEWYIEEL